MGQLQLLQGQDLLVRDCQHHLHYHHHELRGVWSPDGTGILSSSAINHRIIFKQASFILAGKKSCISIPRNGLRQITDVSWSLYRLCAWRWTSSLPTPWLGTSHSPGQSLGRNRVTTPRYQGGTPSMNKICRQVHAQLITQTLALISHRREWFKTPWVNHINNMHNKVERFYEVGLMDQFELCIRNKHNKEHRLGFSFYPSSTQSENGKMTITEHSQVPDLHQHPHVDLLLQVHEHQCTLRSPTNRLDILDSIDHESNKTTRKIGFVCHSIIYNDLIYFL